MKNLSLGVRHKKNIFRDNGLELDARRQFVPPMRHPVVNRSRPLVLEQAKTTNLATPKIILKQVTARTKAISAKTKDGNPFGSSLRSSTSKSVLSRWSYSLRRGRPSQKSITWYSADDQTSSQISTTTSPSSLSPIHRTPLSSSETLYGTYKIPEYTFMEELQRRLNELHLPQEPLTTKIASAKITMQIANG